MIDNYAGENVIEEFQEEREEALAAMKKIARRRRIFLISGIMLGIGGLRLVACFDWRLALGMLFLMCGDNAARASRQ